MSRWGQAARETIPALVLLAYTACMLCACGGLLGFHLFLIATNQTTKEAVK